jgi:protein TonB
MFSIKDCRGLKGRRQAAALFVSALFHVLVLSVFSIFELYRLKEHDAPFKDLVFISYPGDMDDVRLIGIKKHGAGAGGPKKSIRGGTAPKRESPKPPSPEPPLSPIPTEEIEERFVRTATPAPPERAPATYNPVGLGLAEGAAASSFSQPADGSFGWSGNGGAGTGEGPGRGTGGIGTGNGGGLPGSGSGDEIKERVIGTDTGPLLVKMSPPVYPKYARRMGREGRVVLSILIDESGRLIEAHVIEKAGHGFDEAAIEAVRLSKFKSALENGVPIACRARLAVRFRLKDDM